ncbi:hypothetical protein BC834DRAFT_879640 [Gloeopeniophorella convolvens]|nr:hypothetical protein BC834DRAFT_879640 [Gloeopeniophorella convolvens]
MFNILFIRMVASLCKATPLLVIASSLLTLVRNHTYLVSFGASSRAVLCSPVRCPPRTHCHRHPPPSTVHRPHRTSRRPRRASWWRCSPCGVRQDGSYAPRDARPTMPRYTGDVACQLYIAKRGAVDAASQDTQPPSGPAVRGHRLCSGGPHAPCRTSPPHPTTRCRTPCAACGAPPTSCSSQGMQKTTYDVPRSPQLPTACPAKRCCALAGSRRVRRGWQRDAMHEAIGATACEAPWRHTARWRRHHITQHAARLTRCWRRTPRCAAANSVPCGAPAMVARLASAAHVLQGAQQAPRVAVHVAPLFRVQASRRAARVPRGKYTGCTSSRSMPRG